MESKDKNKSEFKQNDFSDDKDFYVKLPKKHPQTIRDIESKSNIEGDLDPSEEVPRLIENSKRESDDGLKTKGKVYSNQGGIKNIVIRYRKALFFLSLWLISVSFVVMVFEPYGGHMSENEFMHMLSIMAAPLILYNVVKYIYWIYKEYIDKEYIIGGDKEAVPELKSNSIFIKEAEGDDILERFDAIYNILPRFNSFQISLLLINIQIYIAQMNILTKDSPFKGLIKDLFFIDGEGYLDTQEIEIANLFVSSLKKEFNKTTQEFNRIISEDNLLVNGMKNQDFTDLLKQHHLNAYMSYYANIIVVSTMWNIVNDKNIDRTKGLWKNIHNRSSDIDDAILFRRDLFDQIQKLSNSPDPDIELGINNQSIKTFSSELPKFLDYL